MCLQSLPVVPVNWLETLLKLVSLSSQNWRTSLHQTFQCTADSALVYSMSVSEAWDFQQWEENLRKQLWDPIAQFQKAIIGSKCESWLCRTVYIPRKYLCDEEQSQHTRSSLKTWRRSSDTGKGRHQIATLLEGLFKKDALIEDVQLCVLARLLCTVSRKPSQLKASDREKKWRTEVQDLWIWICYPFAKTPLSPFLNRIR